MEDYISLRTMEVLFRQDHRTIIRRALAGEFKYERENGKWLFDTQHLLENHKEELYRKNNYGPVQEDSTRNRSRHAFIRSTWARRKGRANKRRRLR